MDPMGPGSPKKWWSKPPSFASFSSQQLPAAPRDTPGTFNGNTTFIHHLPHIIRGIHEGLTGHRAEHEDVKTADDFFGFKGDQRVGCFFSGWWLKNMLVKMGIFTQVGVKIDNISNHHL